MSIEDLGPDLAHPFDSYGKSFMCAPMVRVNKYFLLGVHYLYSNVFLNNKRIS